jgi:hypothetical protein
MTDNIGTFAGCNDVALPSLVISKINYNPDESTEFPESDDQEFIEITNAGTQQVTLSGIYLRELGISYQFPANSTIQAGQRIYIASNSTVFESKYGTTAFGQYQRFLSNGSQNLVLADAFGNIIDEVEYDDDSPWPDADGNGSYLKLTDISLDNSLASSWTASQDINLAVTSFAADNGIVMYPNPVGTMLTVKTKDGVSAIEIYDIYGKLIYNEKGNATQLSIDFSSYAPGIYIVKAVNGKGSKIQKIVKQ